MTERTPWLGYSSDETGAAPVGLLPTLSSSTEIHEYVYDFLGCIFRQSAYSNIQRRLTCPVDGTHNSSCLPPKSMVRLYPSDMPVFIVHIYRILRLLRSSRYPGECRLTFNPTIRFPRRGDERVDRTGEEVLGLASAMDEPNRMRPGTDMLSMVGGDAL